jgi:Ser-tRNA(Ala) deacylase AlaX
MITLAQIGLPGYNDTGTAQAGTKEWLEASKNMVIVSYVDTTTVVRSLPIEDSDDDALFGTHIKETVVAFKNLLGR